MNTAQNGKGDGARNNWGQKWYAGYDAIDWGPRKRPQRQVSASEPQACACPDSREQGIADTKEPITGSTTEA